MKSFTDAFEEELIKSRRGTPLQRREYRRLFAQRSSEIQVRGIDSISGSSLEALKNLSADVVIFGEVTDDTESGEVQISVRIEGFQTQIGPKDSVLLKRGLRKDISSRQVAMKQLVTKILAQMVPLRSSQSEDINKVKNTAVRFSGSLSDPSCGGYIYSVSKGSLEPFSGYNAILNPSNNDCILGPKGRGMEVHVQLCPEAATKGVSTIAITKGDIALAGIKGGVYASVKASGAALNGENFRPIFKPKKSFSDDVTLRSKGSPIKGLQKLKIEISGKSNFQLQICSIEVN